MEEHSGAQLWFLGKSPNSTYPLEGLIASLFKFIDSTRNKGLILALIECLSCNKSQNCLGCYHVRLYGFDHSSLWLQADILKMLDSR